MNILLITADHMRSDALGCNLPAAGPWALASVIKTPNIDRLARSGVTFLNAYSPNPICVPARASITTGNYSHTCTGHKGMGGTILPDQPRLGRVFADAGYATCAVGKLHYVPYSPPGQERLVHGFGTVDLNEEGRIIGQFDPHGKMTGLEEYHDYLAAAGYGGYERSHGIGNNDMRPAACTLPAEHHEEAWVATRTIHHLQRHLAAKDGRPFLMWASFAKPHSPYDPPPPFDRMYDPRSIPAPLGGWDDDSILDGRDIELHRRRKIYGWDMLSPQCVQAARAYYAGMVSFQDQQIGRILDFIESAGLAGETIVVYSCDHGDLLGDFGRFFKATMHDASAKVPFIWRAPSVAGRDGVHHRTQLAGLQDILPTLCSLTGVGLAQEVQGVDLSGVLADAGAAGQDCIFSETGQEAGNQKAMIRTADWKYSYCDLGGVEELYDMRTPMGEVHNLAGDSRHAGVLADLRGRLVQWAVDTGDTKLVAGGKLAFADEAGLPPPVFEPAKLGWRWY